jgi:hypothetical protein
MAALDTTQKADIYETLSRLNMAFAGIIQHLQTLQKTGLFNSKASKLFPSFALELQAEFNQEFLEDLHDLELDECTTTGKHGNAGKSACAILTMCCCKPKNAKSNLRNSVRNDECLSKKFVALLKKHGAELDPKYRFG